MPRRNPFYLKVLPLDAPFCNRRKELKELTDYGYSDTSVVIYSPRREGKTSLVNRVQNELRKSDTVTIKTDFFSVFSVDDIAVRFAKAVFNETRKYEPWYKKAIAVFQSFRPAFQPDPMTNTLSLTLTSVSGKTGFDLLEDVLVSIKELSDYIENPINIFIDEFQEITTLKESAKIEGLLRTYMQETKASFFYVGSRRRILFDMFNKRNRPFYKLAVNYPIEKIEAGELAFWVRDQFNEYSVNCKDELAEKLVGLAHRHIFYVQKLGLFTFNLSGDIVTESILMQAYEDMLESEKTVFEESYIKPLAPAQRHLLIALAGENTKQPFSKDFVKRHNLPAISTLQSALKVLLNEDLIHVQNDVYSVVDKVFQDYLVKNY